MKILVTNDDGIFSEGIRILIHWALKLGEVTVAAPRKQQSGKSHAIAIDSPFKVKKVQLGLGEVAAYAVDSTPVDCVRFATLGLKQNYDLILSGVNKGLNMGEDLLYSGTAGAIFEAKLRDCCGIAFSTEYDTFQYAKGGLEEVWKFFQEKKLLEQNMIYNVNIPANYKGVLVTRQGGAYFSDEWVYKGHGTWEQHGYCVHQNNHDHALDTDATIDGYITVTPLTVDRSKH